MSKDYFVGVNPRELERLRDQHLAWLPETKALWSRAGFSSGQHLLDAGCGPGFTTIELSKIVGPTGKVVGLDKAEKFLNHLKLAATNAGLENISTADNDITIRGNIEGIYDGAFTRWFLAFLIQDLDTVIAELHKVLKPGGILACMEYLTIRSVTCCPPSIGFHAHTKAWIDYYLKNGGDTEIGSYLPQRLVAAGFQVRSIECVGGFTQPGDRWWNWWFRLIEDFGETLVSVGVMTEAELESANQYFKRSASDPAALIYTPVILQLVAEKV